VVNTWGQAVLFPLAVILTDIGSLINSMCIFGFLFHLPKWHGLLVSMSNNCYYVSAMLPVLLRFLVDSGCVASFADGLLWYGIVGVLVISLPAFWFVLPSQAEYFAEAQKVLGLPMPRPPVRGEVDSWSGYLRRLWRRARIGRQVSLSRRVLFSPATLKDHVLVFLACTIGSVAIFVYTNMPTPFGKALFGHAADGQRLASMMATNLALQGVFVGPLAGVVIDRAGGVPRLLLANAISLLAFVCCTTRSSWHWQYAAVICANFFTVTLVTTLTKYVLAFASPTRLGTTQGLFVSLFSMFCVPFIVSYTCLVNSLEDPEHPARAYTWPAIVLSFAGSALFFALWWSLKLPTEPPMLPEDERELSQRFMVESLQDATEVLELPRGEILRRSSSTNPLDLRTLALLTSASSPRLQQLAKRKVERMDMAAMRRPQFERDFGEGWRVSDRTQSVELLTDLVLDAFWPPYGANYSGSQLMTRYFSANRQRGEPTHDEELDVVTEFQSMSFTTGYHMCCGFGHLLELWHEGQVAAAMYLLPPSVRAEVGSDEYYFGIAQSGTFALPALTTEFQRKVLEIDACMAAHKPKWLHWYVQTLATSGAHRGRGCGSKLLRVVREWALRDGVPIYLETDGDTAPFYEKVGFKRIWSDWLEGNGPEEALEVVGLEWR